MIVKSRPILAMSVSMSSETVAQGHLRVWFTFHASLMTHFFVRMNKDSQATAGANAFYEKSSEINFGGSELWQERVEI